MTFDRKAFEEEKILFLEKQNKNEELQELALKFITEADKVNYEYQWTWLGMPIIQMPEDIVLFQEIIWETQPDIIIETGIAWGGGVVLYASILELIGKGKVIAIDTVLPQKNIDQIMKFPFSKRIHLLEGSSTDLSIFEKVKTLIQPKDKVMVILDSNHTHEHVYNELNLYAPLVSQGQYVIAQDTIIEKIPQQAHRVRPWGKGNSPLSAVEQFIAKNKQFTNSNPFNRRALTSCHMDGYLMRSV